MQTLRIIVPWGTPGDVRRAAEGLRVARRLGLPARISGGTQYPHAAAIVLDWETIGHLYRALAVLVAVNRSCLRVGNLPSLYSAGVRYKREPRGQEDFVSAPVLYRIGAGDCDDLAPARCADLRHAGEPATLYLKPTRIGYHVQVKRASGAMEDPSRRLGMPG